jgi:hypothetical protein
MDDDKRQKLQGKIARYKVLARLASDEETQRRIDSLVFELEQQLEQSGEFHEGSA